MSAIRGTIARFSSLSDGTIRYVVDVSPADDHTGFHVPHGSVALALLTETPETVTHPSVGSAAPSAARVSRPYGAQAQTLRLSGFFRTPDVWKAIGTDKQFRAWVATQDCIATSIGEGCHGDVIAAHVRRIADGAGTGIKPDYACIPLCHGHHTEQHQHGESAIAPKEKWDQWRIQTVEKWCWETLRSELGYAHWYDVPPTVLLAWAEHACVDRYLPNAYLAAAA